MTTSTIPEQGSLAARIIGKEELEGVVDEVVKQTPVIDIHTHLYAPQFGELNLFGIDSLLTYHYLIAELFRSSATPYDDFWTMSKSAQADLIWRTLFVENTPISEATRGVITVLNAFGLDTAAPDLDEARAFFASRKILDHLNQVLTRSGVSDVVMTNDPFDPQEVEVWESSIGLDQRFHAALRMDRLLNDWENAVQKLQPLGYQVDRNLSGQTANEVRRFLDRWIDRMHPLYMAVSLPDDFKYPDNNARDRIIREVVLPVALEHKLPFAVMIGVRRQVNPALRMAGDGLGRADVGALVRLCAENPDVRLLATFLSRENQHELCVAARKFSNLMPFGCWWFLNASSIISEITSERLELLGQSFIPQHSDARVLEHLIYKWEHSRALISEALCTAYKQLLNSGRAVTSAEIERDVKRMFSGNFRTWVGLAARLTD